MLLVKHPYVFLKETLSYNGQNSGYYYAGIMVHKLIWWYVNFTAVNKLFWECFRSTQLFFLLD